MGREKRPRCLKGRFMSRCPKLTGHYISRETCANVMGREKQKSGPLSYEGCFLCPARMETKDGTSCPNATAMPGCTK
jgi:hypothetical protein